MCVIFQKYKIIISVSRQEFCRDAITTNVLDLHKGSVKRDIWLTVLTFYKCFMKHPSTYLKNTMKNTSGRIKSSQRFLLTTAYNCKINHHWLSISLSLSLSLFYQVYNIWLNLIEEPYWIYYAFHSYSKIPLMQINFCAYENFVLSTIYRTR